MQAQRIADFLSARVIGNPARDITAAASLSTAGPSDLSFIEDAKYLDRAAHCRAGAVLAGEFAADGVRQLLDSKRERSRTGRLLARGAVGLGILGAARLGATWTSMRA